MILLHLFNTYCMLFNTNVTVPFNFVCLLALFNYNLQNGVENIDFKSMESCLHALSFQLRELSFMNYHQAEAFEEQYCY